MRLRLQGFLVFVAVSLLPEDASSSSSDDQLINLMNAFVVDYKKLDIPEFDYSYEKNFQTMQDLSGIQRQIETFQNYAQKLRQIQRSKVTGEHRYLYDHFDYEIGFNLERLGLEKEFKTWHSDFVVSAEGLAQLPHHRRWYRMYVKRWSARQISFAELLDLGVREIGKVTREIKAIQESLGYGGRDADFYDHLSDDVFLIKDEEKVLDAYKEIQEKASHGYKAIFSDTDIPSVNIKSIPDANKDTPPGYYTEDTFYFNFFGGVHNRRVMDWLFIHEGIPGHHYNASIERKLQLPCPEFMQLFWYPGYSEGWGAYTEHLGKDIGLYGDEYSYLGKWEWDLVRSTRVVLDVGINLYGWSNERALRYWRRHIPNQDSIAMREIEERMRKWPAQVLSYKVGEDVILRLREYAANREGKNFDLKKFHSVVLSRGSIPLDVLETLVKEAYE